MSWYQSEIPKEWIQEIVVERVLTAESWDEQWVSEDLHAVCCRKGSTLYLVGEHIPVQAAMFSGFVALKEIRGLEQLDASKALDLSAVFADCVSLQRVNVKGWVAAKCRNASHMFYNCHGLQQLDLSSWKLDRAEDLSGMFSGCLNVEWIDFGSNTLPKVKTISRLCLDCRKLRTVAASAWTLPSLEDASFAFSCCYELKELEVSGWCSQTLTNLEGTFNRCTQLKTLDVSGWNTERVSNFRHLFFACRSLKILDLRQWTFREDADLRDMFLEGCAVLRLPRQRAFRTLLPDDRWFRCYLHVNELGWISRVHIKVCKQPPLWYDACWAVDCYGSGSVQVFRQGDLLLIDCRRKVLYCNTSSIRTFSLQDGNGRSWLKEIEGLEHLNTRYTCDFRQMFAFNASLPQPQVLEAGFDFRRAQWTEDMFAGCKEPLNKEQRKSRQAAVRLL